MKLTLGQFVPLEAKPGKEEEVASFLADAAQMTRQEPTTPLWFAVRFSRSGFAIFDAFRDDAGRQAHLNGPIAAALMAQAPSLFTSPPVIESLEVVGAKLP
ncbi:MAG: antibiotic biosynthesis monooxygenase [Acidobacteriales bacterium]|jgi:quinol monooxygenase YgiN|nr:antibiotic biosynthesis monooxygenase [Terriglobales bacterium]